MKNKKISLLVPSFLMMVKVCGASFGFYFEENSTQKAENFVLSTEWSETLVTEENPHNWEFTVETVTEGYWRFWARGDVYQERLYLNIKPENGMIEAGTFLGIRNPLSDADEYQFNFAGFGKGLYSLTADLKIYEVSYLDGEIESLAIDFCVYEATGGDQNLLNVANGDYAKDFGSYRFNSTIPVNTTGEFLLIPEPAPITSALLGLGILWFTSRPRR